MVERDIPAPGPGFVRVRIEASGICHSDVLTKEGLWPGLAFPRVPGHEIAGVADAFGPGASAWSAGDRVVHPERSEGSRTRHARPRQSSPGFLVTEPAPSEFEDPSE